MKRVSARDDRGAVAVITAICAVLIFSLASVAVDLGNAYARKRDIQTQADLAALAAGAELPHAASTESAILDAASEFATSNETYGQTISDWDFTDDDLANGYVEFFDNPNRLRVVTPRSTVEYGFAGAMGFSDVEVAADATVEIRSPGRSLPFFVSQVCSTGLQTIIDESAGPPVPPGYTPTLSPSSSPAWSTVIGSVSHDSADIGAPTFELVVTSTTPNGMNQVNAVGFTTESGDHYAPAVVGSGNSVSVDVPEEVLATEAVWWVRVRGGASNRWSAAVNAKPFVVGEPEPVGGGCNSKNTGNFGSLSLSRNDVASGFELQENVALGIQHGLADYPPPHPEECENETSSVMDSGSPEQGRLLNCLTTDSGADVQMKATRGLITGTGSSPARLDGAERPTADGCDPEGGSASRAIDPSGPGYYEINNDVLSCYITNPSVTVGQITGTAAPANVLSPEIFESPRFFWLPVLVDDPSGGRSGSYAIVRIVPAFVTGQPDAATSTMPLPALNEGNGVQMSSPNPSAIEKVRVRVINPAALPLTSVEGDSGSIEYVGEGTKLLKLVE